MGGRWEFRKEVVPYCCSGLAPRNYLSDGDWTKIRAKRMAYVGGLLCEQCGYVGGDKDKCGRVKKIHLHESFLIEGNVFKLRGLFLLCDSCHSKVHWGVEGLNGYRIALIEEKGILEAMNQGLWGFHKNVWVDFSFLEEYGVSSVLAEGKFYSGVKYNHQYAYIRAVQECVFVSYIWGFSDYLKSKKEKNKTLKFVYERISGDEETMYLLLPFVKEMRKYRKKEITPFTFRDLSYEFCDLATKHFDAYSVVSNGTRYTRKKQFQKRELEMQQLKTKEASARAILDLQKLYRSGKIEVCELRRRLNIEVI